AATRPHACLDLRHGRPRRLPREQQIADRPEAEDIGLDGAKRRIAPKLRGLIDGPRFGPERGPVAGRLDALRAAELEVVEPRLDRTELAGPGRRAPSHEHRRRAQPAVHDLAAMAVAERTRDLLEDRNPLGEPE